MELSYKEYRDSDFFAVCENIRKEFRGKYMSVDSIAKIAVHRKAKSFYLNEKVYCMIIRNARIGKIETAKSPHKKELYMEIFNHYIRIKRENPNYCIMDCARIISEQEAPRFYISEGRAINLYYELLKPKPQ